MRSDAGLLGRRVGSRTSGLRLLLAAGLRLALGALAALDLRLAQRVGGLRGRPAVETHGASGGEAIIVVVLLLCVRSVVRPSGPPTPTRVMPNAHRSWWDKGGTRFRRLAATPR